MPHITSPRFKWGMIRELDTDQGFMKVVREGGGLYTYFFDTSRQEYGDKMENLRLWFLEHKGKDLVAAVPELTVTERKLILEGGPKEA